MSAARLTGDERARLKGIWQRSCDGFTFSHYEMNFVLGLLKERTDLVDQAFEKDSDYLAHLLPTRTERTYGQF